MPDDRGKMTPMDWVLLAQAALPIILALIEMFKKLSEPNQEKVLNKIADVIAPVVPS